MKESVCACLLSCVCLCDWEKEKASALIEALVRGPEEEAGNEYPNAKQTAILASFQFGAVWKALQPS